MAKIAFNKSSLKAQRDMMETYKKFLPSLDLKKQQLLLETTRAQRQLEQARQRLATFQRQKADWMALLSSTPIDLIDLVTLVGWETREENLVGVILPVLGEVKFQVKPYTTLGSPVWIDALVDALQTVAGTTLELRILERRVDLLGHALKKVTQRINLFEKVLIPECQANIRTIKLFLSDNERTAVSRSKLAKARLNSAERASSAATDLTDLTDLENLTELAPALEEVS